MIKAIERFKRAVENAGKALRGLVEDMGLVKEKDEKLIDTIGIVVEPPKWPEWVSISGPVMRRILADVEADRKKLRRLSYRKSRSQQKNWSHWKKRK